MGFSDIIPHSCVYLDCCWRDILYASEQCVVPCGNTDRSKLIADLEKLWTHPQDTRCVLPTLSVRTALDLYLQLKKYPPGSEIIISGINIPDMVKVLHEHKLKLVPIDVNLENMMPKVENMESLVSDKTVAILIAHIYGKRFSTEPFVRLSQRHNIPLIEDCAEVFSGFEWMGSPDADLSLFSFGSIKFYTSFGGAITKVKDPVIYEKMKDLYATYPIQSSHDYLKKCLKLSVLYALLNCPKITKLALYTSNVFGIDHQKHAVNMLRGFPGEMIQKIRTQPCTSLLQVMCRRQHSYSVSDIEIARSKGDYVNERLPESVTQVGTQADVNNYWLFPIIVDNPDEILKVLRVLGVDAYRGATQLSIIEPDNGSNHLKHLNTFVTRYPHEAKFLIDRVVYLPVNKHVPFSDLDKICVAVDVAVQCCSDKQLLPLQQYKKLKMKSKL